MRGKIRSKAVAQNMDAGGASQAEIFESAYQTNNHRILPLPHAHANFRIDIPYRVETGLAFPPAKEDERQKSFESRVGH